MDQLPSGSELHNWYLIAIQRLGGSGRAKTIDEEVKRMFRALRLPEHEANKLQVQGGYRRDDLRKSLHLTRRGGVWRLTRKGENRASDQMKRKRREIDRIERKLNRDLEVTAEKLGLDSEKIRLLQTHDISLSELRRLLEGQGRRCGVDPTSGRSNLQIERKAIEHILKIEEHLGWETTAPNNPGFDLCRVEELKGHTIWCEVKSLSGPFQQVELTPTEFRKANKAGDAYWLYIVENVGTDNVNIIRIQNPAGNTRRFVFDSRNWRAESDDAPIRSSSG